MSGKSPRNKLEPLANLPRASATDLRGRQSVRVAFKLTPTCIEAMHILGTHLGLKPKSLFDHMVQDRRSLDAIAAGVARNGMEENPRAAKTYVISRDAAVILDGIARSHQVPRDLLVEASVRYLMPLIEREQVRHRSRQALLTRMERHLKDGRKLLEAMTSNLGPHDPMSDKMQQIMGVYERAYAAMAEFIRKGKKIEGFDIE